MKHTKLHIVLIAFCFAFTTSFAQEIDPTDISFVSLNPYTNEVSVAWYKSESPNIKFVRIHYVYDESSIPVAKTIIDIPQNTDDTLLFKTDSLSLFPKESYEVPLSFAADAYSQNGDNSTTIREYHTTMHCVSEFHTCPTEIQISWTPYFGYGVAISKYELIEVTGINTESVIAQIPSTKQNAVIPLNNNSSRHFFIRAVFIDCKGIERNSLSNMVECNTPIFKYPTFIHAENCNVNSENDINVIFSSDTATSFTKYAVFRSFNNKNHYQVIDSLELQKSEIMPYSYTHNASFLIDSISYYKIVAYNNCGDEIISSTDISPILLKGIEIDDTKHLLQWTTPTFWTEGVATYSLYRITNNINETKVYETIAGNSTFDDISNNFKVGAKICYRIEAKQNRDSLPNTSISNTFCFDKTYRIVIPNALNPYSKIAENTVFKPKYAFVSGTYSMKIYNRFGDCIFESTDIEEGWNGKVKDVFAPQGSYQYKIIIQLPTGQTIDKVGNVNLIFQK